MYMFAGQKIIHARFVSYLFHKCGYKFPSALLSAEERFETDLSWLKLWMVRDLERWYEAKKWIDKGMCPCCKEATCYPVYGRGTNSAECMRCR